MVKPPLDQVEDAECFLVLVQSFPGFSELPKAVCGLADPVGSALWHKLLVMIIKSGCHGAWAFRPRPRKVARATKLGERWGPRQACG